jgi:fumarate hydratase class II
LATSPFRTEKDSMGAMEVPSDAFYGAQTRRAELNFEISPLRAPRAFIRAMGLIKKAAAQVNMDLGLLNPDLGAPIVQAAQAVADGKHDDQFVVDIFQTGSGTSTNMNTNEVIAGVANEKLTGQRGGKSPVHPNDAVNMGQSSNDVIPTAIHVAALEGVRKKLIPVLENLQKLLQAKADAFDHVVKIGRTHLQDAVPIRLGQEFSGYASQVEHGVRRLVQASASLAELAIGGTALGTGINTHAEFPQRMAEHLNHDTGLEFRPASNTFEAMANRDAAVEVSGALRTVAISLSNIANNVRWLASGPRCGIGEIRIPELQPGSSIMPAKVNPVIPEAVMMVGGTGRGERRHDRLVQRPGVELRPQRHDAGDRLQPAPVDRPPHGRREALRGEVHRCREAPEREDRVRGDIGPGRRGSVPRPDRAEPGDVHVPGSPDRLRRGRRAGEEGVHGWRQRPPGRAREGGRPLDR